MELLRSKLLEKKSQHKRTSAQPKKKIMSFFLWSKKCEVKTIQAKSSQIEALPSEILLRIFSYLDEPELLVLPRVCRAWVWLSEDETLWHRIFLSKSKQQVTPVNATSVMLLSSEEDGWKRHCQQLEQQRLIKSLRDKFITTAVNWDLARNEYYREFVHT